MARPAGGVLTVDGVKLLLTRIRQDPFSRRSAIAGMSFDQSHALPYCLQKEVGRLIGTPAAVNSFLPGPGSSLACGFLRCWAT